MQKKTLTLKGKKKNISRNILFDYYGRDRMNLTLQTLEAEEQNLIDKRMDLTNLIAKSFLSEEMKEKYIDLLGIRYDRLLTVKPNQS